MLRWSVGLVFVVGCSSEAHEPCPVGQVLCDEVCASLDYDPRNCGACGTQCDADQVCSSGMCEDVCPAGFVVCGGACVDPDTDGAFCGATGDCVGANAGEACDAGQVCNGAGACELTCQAGLVDCGGTCIDPDTDRAHCGASSDCAGANAGDVCEAGEICNGAGVCELSCQSGLVDCGGKCIDPNTDAVYCGVAGDCSGGEACDDSRVCNGAGACERSCQSGLLNCGGFCVDPHTDRTFCGATDDCVGANIGETCDPGEVCNGAGACELSCQAGLVECGGKCIDPDTDRAFCGATGDCDGANAGDACADGEVCNGAGDCEPSCQAGLTDCDGQCTDVDHDPLNCRGCGSVCSAPDNAFGYCAPEGCRTACLAGYSDCGGDEACETSTDGDEQNCGGCGIVCDVDEECAVGHCVDHVTMFGTSSSYDGDLVEHAIAAGGAPANGREAADYLCTMAVPGGLSCFHVRAFLSVSETDEMRDMPDNYGVPVTVPVRGPTSAQIDVSFPALLDGSISASTGSAGVAGGGIHWTASNADGSLDTSSGGTACSGWTNDDEPEMTTGQGTFAEAGWNSTTDGTWLARGSSVWCGNDETLLCLCY